jgi:hypothetical protein
MEEQRPKPGQPITGKRSTPSRPLTQGDKEGLASVLRDAGRGGCVEVTSHFKMRGAQRGFSTPEALSVLRRGRIVSGPEFCAEFCNWKFLVELEHDNGDLVIVAGVCAGEKGQIWSRNVLLITGFVR